MPRVLIVAYGNPLRGDDGLAWSVADDLEQKLDPSEVAILRRHQLAPELAEDLSRCEVAIFVDAALSDAAGQYPGEMRVEEIAEEEPVCAGPVRFSHQLSPRVLVALAAQLYRSRPRAFCATLGGQDFDHGESLSAVVAASLPKFVAEIEDLVRRVHRG